MTTTDRMRADFIAFVSTPHEEFHELAYGDVMCPERAGEIFDSWLDGVQAQAWEKGAEHAWRATGEGWNGEYAYGHGTHDGSVSFREAMGNDDGNPYRKEQK